MAKKLTTEEILAACRAQGAFGSGGIEAAATPTPAATEPVADETAADEPSADDSSPAEPESAAPPASTGSATPGSTADILAAARAQGAGGAAKPAAPKPPAAKPAASQPAAGSAPKSTADILAAARAQGSGAAKKPAAATPGSTADILAAARAQAKGSTAATAKSAAKAAPKGAPAEKKGVGAKTVAEMLAAARQADSAPAAARQAVAADTRPKLPGKKLSEVKKPAGKAGKAGKGAPATRRGFLATLSTAMTPFTIGWNLLGAATTAFGLGVARFMMPNVLVEPPTKFKIGSPGDYPPGTVSTKWKAQRGIWVVNTQYRGKPMIYALSTVCTHLGCTPSWLEGEQKFKCPCHGSGFYITGINFEGPAPRPLERVGLRLSEDGMLEVDKSIKFQEEMGQWEDPASFYGLV